MASVIELVAVFVIVAFVIGAAFGVIFIVVAEVKAEESVARKQRVTTLRDEPTNTMARGVRKLLTGVSSYSSD